MKLIIKFLILILNIIGCHKQTKNNNYQDFFNQILEPNTIVLDEEIRISSDLKNNIKNFILSSEKLKGIVSREDVYYIEKQIKKDYSFRTKNIDRKLINNKTLDKIFSKEKNLNESWEDIYKIGKGYYKLTVPVFNKNEDLAFCSIEYHCGSLCSYIAVIRVYKKNDEKWVYYTDLMPIIKS